MQVPATYDALFARLVPQLPTTYVRSLAYMESGLNPNNTTPADAPASRGARGLMQVMNVNRRDYNEKHGTNWSSEDMFDPEKNVRVFADTVGRMLRVYRRDGIVGSSKPTSRRELLLVTAGWNSGYGDVRRLASWLKQRGLPVVHENLYQYAPQALPADAQRRWTTRKRDWQRRVVSLYGRQRESETEGDRWFKAMALLWLASKL